MPPNVASGHVCAATFIFIMKAMACIMGYHSDQPSNSKISSSTSHSHKSIKTYHLSFQNCLCFHRDLSHWIGQDKTVLNWNGSVQTTQTTLSARLIACKLIARNYQIPMWKVWTAIQFSCNKQSLIWWRKSKIWWKTGKGWHPLALYFCLNAKSMIKRSPQSNSLLLTFSFKSKEFSSWAHSSFSAFDLVFWTFTQLKFGFPFGVILCLGHSPYWQLAFQMVPSWGAHFSPGSFPGRQVWRAWLGNDSCKSPI